MHQDFGVCYPDLLSGLIEFWNSLKDKEKCELIDFLEHINSSDLPGGMQKKYWHKSGAQIYPSKIKVFFSELLNEFLKLQKNESS